MQSDAKDIYKITAERTGKSEEVYKDLGNFIFAETYSHIRDPKTLIINLKGIGRWFLRKKRLEIITMEHIDRGDVQEKTDFQNDKTYAEYLEKCRIHRVFLDRLVEYEEYLRLKKEIEAERRKTQFLIPPKEDDRFKID